MIKNVFAFILKKRTSLKYLVKGYCLVVIRDIDCLLRYPMFKNLPDPVMTIQVRTCVYLQTDKPAPSSPVIQTTFYITSTSFRQSATNTFHFML